MADPSFIVPLEDIGISDSLSLKEVPGRILDQQVCLLQMKDVALKVLWRNQKSEKAIWDAKVDMESKYPHWFFHKLVCMVCVLYHILVSNFVKSEK